MSYDGDEEGMDLSWESDLKTAWADRGDEFTERATGTSTADASGETVGGTTADDYGSETTSLLPDGVDASELTEKQLSILKTAVMQPTGSKVEIAATAGTSPQWVATTCTRWYPGHPAATPSDNTDTAQMTLDDWGSRDGTSDDDTRTGSIVEEMVKCGKESCKCADGDRHGPYLYRYWSENGTTRSEYIGKPGGDRP